VSDEFNLPRRIIEHLPKKQKTSTPYAEVEVISTTLLGGYRADLIALRAQILEKRLTRNPKERKERSNGETHALLAIGIEKLHYYISKSTQRVMEST
jgi:hypothetical protein